MRMNVDDYADQTAKQNWNALSIYEQSEIRKNRYASGPVIKQRCFKSLYERSRYVGKMIENELDIIAEGGDLDGVSLGDRNRNYVAYDDVNDSLFALCGEEIWIEERKRSFWLQFFERGFFERMNFDFQYPLVVYLEQNHKELNVYSLLIRRAILNKKPVTKLPFSDEMVREWLPLREFFGG